MSKCTSSLVAVGWNEFQPTCFERFRLSVSWWKGARNLFRTGAPEFIRDILQPALNALLAKTEDCYYNREYERSLTDSVNLNGSDLEQSVKSEP